MPKSFCQNFKDLQVGISLNNGNSRHLLISPLKLGQKIRFLSPGINISLKKHELGIKYDLYTPFGFSRIFSKHRPKGFSCLYSFSFLDKKNFSIHSGFEIRFFEYFYDDGTSILNISRSVDYNSGYLVNLNNYSPNISIRAKWRHFTTDLTANFSRAYVRRYNLGNNRESSLWANYLILNWGITYWIIQ